MTGNGFLPAKKTQAAVVHDKAAFGDKQSKPIASGLCQTYLRKHHDRLHWQTTFLFTERGRLCQEGKLQTPVSCDMRSCS